MKAEYLRVWGIVNKRTMSVEFSHVLKSSCSNWIKMLPVHVRSWFAVVRFDINQEHAKDIES